MPTRDLRAEAKTERLENGMSEKEIEVEVG
jgi:hypothetical protein